jgi:ubiquinone/menaquinone biosynthesis C-methylase UbiE
MPESTRAYIPAAGNHWSLPLYDPIVKLLGADPARRRLLDGAALRPGHRALDVGCGTGDLVVLIKRLHPGVEVVGLDPDPKALDRARRKAERAGAGLRLDRGFSDELPYQDASFDRVFSTLMYHHLGRDEKEGTLREARRVLRPGGLLCLLDFAGPEAGAHGYLARLLHSSGQLEDNGEDRILAVMRRAGLASPEKVGQGAMFFGLARVNYFRASAPAA